MELAGNVVKNILIPVAKKGACVEGFICLLYVIGRNKMLKSKITPDPIRDAPVGEHQAPGPHIILPARAFGDTRFNQFPTTFRVLALCAAHAFQLEVVYSSAINHLLHLLSKAHNKQYHSTWLSW